MSVAAVGGAVIGGAVTMAAAGKAASAQGKASSAANQMTQEQFNTTRLDNNAFTQNGVASNNLLAGYLGTLDDQPFLTFNQLYERAKPNHFKYGHITGKKYELAQPALQEASRLYREQQERRLQAEKMKADGTFGSLLKNFGQEDLDNDVVYQNGFQFALDEGRKGLERMASATGGINNGKVAKALTRFGAQTANQWGNDAYNRFNTNKGNTYNMLSGQSGAGQMAVNQVASAGQNAAQSMGQNMVGMGNARAASAIGQANAITGAIGQGFNMYQQNRLYNNLMDQ